MRSKLYVADYSRVDKQDVVIDRKQNVLEFAGNAGKQHERFKNELKRLDDIGGKMYILIEEELSSLEDIKEWSSKRSQMSGKTLYKICRAWQKRHNIEFVFTSKEKSAQKIIELLGGGDTE